MAVQTAEITAIARAAVHEQDAQQKVGELAALGAYLTAPRLTRPTGGPNPLQVIVEIGVYRGGTAWYWRRLAPHATIVGIDRDIRCDACAHRLAHSNCPRARARQACTELMEADSTSPGVIAEVAKIANVPAEGFGLFEEGAGIDLLFIDGDHSAAGIESDFQNYVPMLSAHGVVVIHDVAGPTPAQIGDGQLTDAVQQFWHNMKKLVPQAFEIIDTDGGPWGGLGVIPKPGDE